MPDFGAILRKARDHANSAGATGATGATREKPLQIKGQEIDRRGPSVETMPGPLGPAPVIGPNGPGADYEVGPGSCRENHPQFEGLSEPGPGGPNGPSEKQSACENHERSASRFTSFEPQADPNRCHVCGESEAAGRLFIAVLTSTPGTHHWLHPECHAEHRRRCAEARIAAAVPNDIP